MAFGVVPEGFAIKDSATIIDEMEQDQRSDIRSDFNTQADSLAGQLNGVVGDKLAEIWEVMGAVYRARQPDSASDEALDNVAAITGAERLAAASSTVNNDLNLDAAVTVPLGSIVSIGPTGAQWSTLAEITNGGADQATVSVSVESVDKAPIAGNAYAIDTIVTPISGWSAKAAFTGLTSEPFVLVNLQTLTIQVDEGTTQVVTFNTADFVSIGAATAQEVIDSIVADTTGISGIDASGFIRLFSDTDGTGSAIKVIGGTGFEPLGLSTELIKGFNPSRSAKIVNANSETYDMTGSLTLLVAIDGGAPQTITFLAGDFAVPATATAVEIAVKINAVLTGGAAYDVAGKVQIESDTIGINSAVEITDGTSNVELGYTLGDIQIGTSGDAVVGRDVESDEDLRLRRVQLLRGAAASTVEAIRAGLLDPIVTPNVAQAFVFENDTDIVDVDGRPAHSFEAVVFGGTDDDIAQTLFDLKPIGIQTFKVAGPDGVTVVIVDSQGTNHTINFSRADVITEHAIVDISVVAADFGGNDQVAGEAQVRAAIKALGDALNVGEDVIILRFKCAPLTIAGVQDVTDIFIEDVDPPTNQANIVITQRELATFATADIDINVVFV